HISLVHPPDPAKPSKRHGAPGIAAYGDEMGTLPGALFNYLLRPASGAGHPREPTRDDAGDVLAVSGVGKRPSRFDLKKLQNLNGHYTRAADEARLAQLAAERIGSGADVALLTEAMPVLKTRARDLNELADGAAFLFKQRPLALTDQAAALLTAEARALLAQISALLGELEDWTTEALEA